MKYLKRMKNEGGFSLVELMVSVGIIGAMSTLAVPRYQKFTANAAQSEAQTSVSSMYTLQQLYFTENDKYATGLKSDSSGPKELDFPVSANARYEYATTASGSDSTQFKATAESKTKLASCSLAAKDKWCVNEKKEMKNDGVAALPCAAGDSANGSCE